MIFLHQHNFNQIKKNLVNYLNWLTVTINLQSIWQIVLKENYPVENIQKVNYIF